jgi:hypothetical protein
MCAEIHAREKEKLQGDLVSVEDVIAVEDVDPSDGLMTIQLGLQPRVQVLEVRLQMLPVLGNFA